MEKQSVYIETTVVSYFTARPSRDLVVAAHQQVTVEWWENSLPLLDPFVSPLVIEEVSRGDETAAKLRLGKIIEFPILEITDEVSELAELYFEGIPIPGKARGDAYHLAVATYHGIDFLVSWNFAHILSPRVREVVQSINTARGISSPLICSPEELMEV
jgi:predicted nucleic acid-binding protein